MEDKRIKNRHSGEERRDTSTTTIEHWIWKISEGEDGFISLVLDAFWKFFAREMAEMDLNAVWGYVQKKLFALFSRKFF